MSELRYPNESREYRDAREALLKDEQELVDKVKSVAEKRRKLPPGGQLKEDYVFQWANDGKVGKTPRSSQLPKPRPIESTRGPNNVDGRRLRWFPDRTLPIKPITNARESLMICNCQ